jgi:CDGSH-type Zn-finger protein/uncharacterized Fe-S cluster protein YjdI
MHNSSHHAKGNLNMAAQLQTLTPLPTREQLLHMLYEAAELEHNLMCTYLYAAFSLKTGTDEGLSQTQADAVSRWRSTIIDVAIEEMSHLTAVWNITSALGGTPRFGRNNFPLDAGYLPAGVVVKLAPFNAATLQHFIHLERPEGSREAEGEGFAYDRVFVRGAPGARLTPMGLDYETVGSFYATLSDSITRFVQAHGESVAFCGEPSLQLSAHELELAGAKPVLCLKTALAAFNAIILQGEGAPEHSISDERSHYQRFAALRTEYQTLIAQDANFKPAHPAATNPVLRRPPRPEGRVWLEDAQAVTTVDIANAAYGLMLRMLAHAYTLTSPSDEKALTVDLALGLMRAVTHLGEHAARLPAGPSNPHCHAGMSFTALRDTAPLPSGIAARRFFMERLNELSEATQSMSPAPAQRVDKAARAFKAMTQRAKQYEQLANISSAPAVAQVAPAAINAAADSPHETPKNVNDVEIVEGQHLTLMFEAKRCIHARFCVTGAPNVFLANVKGAWLHPDAMDVERLADIAHACPSGAIRYARKDGRPNESAPPVNLAAIREAGPYAIRGDLRIDGAPAGFRATLCRCGASKNKPFCDSSHLDVNFAASGEPMTSINSTTTDMLPVRNGPLNINLEPDGPLQVRGNLEITSGTGRVVARITQARLCRCGGSQTKPFCDGTHAKIGFRST